LPANQDAAADAPADAPASVSCTPCGESTECGQEAVCAQYAGGEYCGRVCSGQSDCGKSETCLPTVAEDGAEASVCVPSNGTCGENGCGDCPSGTTCDLAAGSCNEPELDGGDDGGPDEPDDDAGPAPQDGGADAGTVQPHVGPDGGKVNRLFFAIIGDTRPPGNNDTAHYPSAIITKIYDDIQTMNPRPQFVITTGDYMFASPSGVQGEKQMKLYLAARNHYKGTVFAALGNHECYSNCAGVTTNNNYNAFLDGLVKPLGKTKPFYSIPISDIGGKWNAKVVMVACNAWSNAQHTWLKTELAKPTTYTFIVRHHPMGSTAPCTADMAPLLKTAKYNMLAVGHIHRYAHSGKQLLEGVGGAPLSGTFNHGYATVRQLDDGRLRVRQYDYKTKQIVGSFILP
jgi:hypothetical protein